MSFAEHLALTVISAIPIGILTILVTLHVERRNRQKQEELKYTEVKIKIYEFMVKNIRHALSFSKEDFEKFQKEILEDIYYAFCLYASENTLKLFNKFVDERVRKGKNISSVEYEGLVNLCRGLILSMRQDIYPNDKVKLNDTRILVNLNSTPKEKS